VFALSSQRFSITQIFFSVAQRILSADRKNLSRRMLTHLGSAVRWNAWKFERLPRSGFLRIA
jgi:hypothetical protein